MGTLQEKLYTDMKDYRKRYKEFNQKIEEINKKRQEKANEE